MRRFLAFVTLVFSASMMLVLLQTSPASADTVCIESEPVPGTGTIRCILTLDHPHPHPGGTPGTPPTLSAEEIRRNRWQAYGCHLQSPYQPGYEVTTTTLSQIPPENYDIINADTSAPGYRYLEDGTNYFSVLIECGYPGAPPGGVIVTLSEGELGVPAGPDPIALRTEALASVTIPDPPVSANPPHDEPDRFGLVNIPTWFWLDAGYWDPITVTVTDPTGVMTVSVTATAHYADWDPGDGAAPIQCLDAGLEWDPSQPEDASDCSYVYEQSSAGHSGDEYSLSVSVFWEYTWTLDGVDQGAFEDTTLTTPFTYAVGEIQAVES